MFMAILKVCQGIKCQKEAFNDLEMAFILSFLSKEAEELLILQQWNEVCQGSELRAETYFLQIHSEMMQGCKSVCKSEVCLLEGSPIKNFVDCCSDA